MKNFYILLVAIMVTSLSFGQELLVNGDLESWDDTTTLTGWGTFGHDQETADVHGGTYAAKRDGAVNSGTKKIVQTIDVTGGDNYTVSFWYKVVSERTTGDPTHSARVYSTWKDASNTATGDQTDALRFYPTGYTIGDWTEYTATFNAPADAATLSFSVRAYADSTVIWDDLSFMHNATPQPGLSITSPSNGDVFAAGNDVVVNFDVTNFDFATDGHVHYTVGAVDATASDASDITLAGLAAGPYTLFMELVDTNDAPLSTPVNATVDFTVQAFTQVADIAALRASAVDGYYELTGEAFINFAQGHRNQKFIQDGTAGILVDDNSGNITAGARGDGISGIKGKLNAYKGMLQFQALYNATITSPSTLTITPQVVTLADLNTNFEDYEAELVKVENVMLDNSTEANYVTGTLYAMTNGADTFNFRTSFYDADYIDTPVHTTAVNIVGIPTEKTGSGGNDFGLAFTARDLADFSDVSAVAENNIEGFNMYPNPVNNGVLNITTLQNLDKNVQIFDILGKQVLSTTITGNTVNVSKLNAGFYSIKVEEAGNTVTRKLIVK